MFAIVAVLSISKDSKQNQEKPSFSIKALYNQYKQSYSLKEKTLLRNLSIILFIWGAGFMVIPLIPVWFNLQFGVFESSIAIWFALFNIGSVPLLIISDKIRKNFGIAKIIVLIQIATSVAFVLMPISNSFVIAGLCLVFIMILFNLIIPLLDSWIVPRFKPEVRGMTIAILFTMWSITSGITPAIAGYMFNKSLLALPFIISAFLFLVTGLCFYILIVKKEKTSDR